MVVVFRRMNRMEYEFNYGMFPDTNGWDEIHDFVNGWGWHYRKGKEEYYVWQYELKDISYDKLTHQQKVDIALAREKAEKERPKLEIKSFDKIELPRINKPFPKLSPDDILGV